jgi:hypothetical protein
MTVQAQDAAGTLQTCFTNNVAVSLGNPGGATLSGTTTVAAVGGVATFSGLTISKAGSGYTLIVAATGLTAATSTSFTVTAGPATVLAFTTQPATAAAGAAITAVVTARDQFGNTAAGFTGNVTMTIGANPGSGTLSGTATVAAAAGVASFTTLTINKVGTGYTLTATPAGGAPPAAATSSAFNITPGPVNKLVFSVQPSDAAAGVAIAPDIQVTAQDANGNLTPAFTGNVTMAIAANPGGGTLSGTVAVAAVGGIATFSTLSINKPAAGYTLSATSGTLTAATSNAFTISIGALAQLVFTAQPTNATAGVAIAPAVVVTGRDAVGNTVTSFTGNVAVFIGTNPASGTLSGTTTVAAVAGVATFSTLSIDQAGTGYQLQAAAGAVNSGLSSAFTIAAGAATQLSFVVPPGTPTFTSGIAMSPAFQVIAQDGFGNTATTFTGNVQVAIVSNPGSGTLTGTLTKAAVAGIATFSDLKIDKAGTGYTLSGTATGLTGATSAAFNIIPGAATALFFTIQPGNGTAGAAIPGTVGAIQVTARDAQGNTATAFTSNVTMAIGTNPGAGVLTGTVTVAAVAGVTTFSNLSINAAAIGYTLVASSGALTAATSTTFNITAGTATHLAFNVQPSNTTSDAAITPSVKVTALDGSNNVDPTFTGLVNLAIATNPGAGTLSNGSVAAVAGVATFTTLSINKAGTGYTLTATSGALTQATSSAFNITPGAATQLVISVQPTTAVSEASISPAVQVTAQDPAGNTDPTFTANVTMAIDNNPGGGTLSGTATKAAVAGIATFSDLSIDKVGTGYTLIASSGLLATATSNAFNITFGAAAKLAFTVQPITTTAASSLTPAVQVTAQDNAGNSVPTFTANVTMTIGTNPSSGTLGGTLIQAAVAGVATFNDLTIDKVGTGYKLSANSAGLAGGLSDPFDILPGVATKLIFTVEPSNAVAGVAIAPAIQVSAQDAGSNTVPGFVSNVTIAIGTNPGGGALSGTATVAAVAGVATFATLNIDKTGTGYTLAATSGILTAGTSQAFDVTAGAVAQLLFTTQPTNTVAGSTITPNVAVVAQDALGNTATAFTGNVTLTLAVNPGGATPNNATVAAVAGVATFSSLFLDKSGTGYQLQASDGTHISAPSSAFNIIPGIVTHLTFTVQPTVTTSLANINPAVRVAAQDFFNNTVTTFSNNITVAIGNNPSGGTLGGTLNKAAVAGVASFSSLNIDFTGVGYTLTASTTVGGVTGTTSVPFNIIPSVGTRLFFKVQPSSAAAGNIIAPNITVEARDASGQVAAGFGDDVTLSITASTGAPGATLLGTTTATVGNGRVVTGVATFDDIQINQSASNYKLTATATGLTEAVSGFFSITPAAPNNFVYSVQPSNVTALASITPQIEVRAVDVFGNTATSFVDNVTMSISDANASGGTLAGTTTRTAVAGVASFNDLSIDLAQTGHTLDATDAGGAGLGSLTSSSFDVTATTANRLVITAQPTTTVAGQAISTVTLEARDALNSLLTGFSGPVMVTVTSGTGTSGATLAGTTTVSAVSGVVTFSTLSINKKGTGYKLSFTAGGLSGTTSNSFTINAGAAAQVLFTNDPASATAGTTIPGLLGGSVQVTIEDALGNPVTSTANVTVSIFSNPGGGTLSGAATVSAVSGVASFSDLSIDAVAQGYRLQASSAGLTSDISQAFSITAGAATQLVFTVAPSDRTAGLSIVPAIKVTALDALGNVATTFAGNVSVAITSGTGTVGATLSGTTTQTAASGVATFPGLSIDKSGTDYTLSATATGVTGSTSATFNITPAAATHLVFTVQPGNTAANASIAPAVQVTAEDAFGNVATSYTGTVTVAMGVNAGGPGSLLSGTKVRAAVAGVALFDDLSINNTGVGYTITATGASPALPLAGSAAFNIF